MQYYYLTSGIGFGSFSLSSFDSALISSGIGNYNLVKISSILPPYCEERKSLDLFEGSILHTAFATLTSNEVGSVISAAVGVAIPQNNDNVGVIMEYSGFCSKIDTLNQVTMMLEESMSNRGFLIKEMKTVSNEVIVPNNRFASVVAALSLW